MTIPPQVQPTCLFRDPVLPAKNVIQNQDSTTSGNVLRKYDALLHVTRFFHDHSAVGLAPVPDASDGDAVFSDLLEEDPVVSAAETEADHGRLELLYIAAASDKIPVDAVEDVESDLAVDGAEIGLSFERPDD